MKLHWLKKTLPYLAFVIGGALLYDGYVFWSRWSGKREDARLQARQEAALAKKTLSLLGDDALKINAFYAMPGAVRPGAPANICYGVTGATTLKIDPPVEQVWPAANHCIQVRPAKSTEYRLTALDAAGHQVTVSFVLQVVR